MGVKASLKDQGLAPRKRWGQHFLTDPRILGSIADAADITLADTILEIGPGLGHLTRVLAARAAHVTAVEVDAGLAAKLEAELAENPNLNILQGDILEREPVEWLTLNGKRKHEAGVEPASISYKVVANLPYYITSAILRYLLEAAVKPRLIVVMVQREVAQRMIARPPSTNLLAVTVQFLADVRIVRTIAAGAFYPRPKVDSAVVRLDVLERPRFDIADTDGLFTLVRAGFGERRKQLRNSLGRGLNLEPAAAEALLTRALVDPRRRAESLSLAEWAGLGRAWERAKSDGGLGALRGTR